MDNVAVQPTPPQTSSDEFSSQSTMQDKKNNSMNKDNVEKFGLLRDIVFLIVLILMYLGIFFLPWPKGEENWGVLFLVIPIFIAIIYRIGLIINKAIHYIVF